MYYFPCLYSLDANRQWQLSMCESERWWRRTQITFPMLNLKSSISTVLVLLHSIFLSRRHHQRVLFTLGKCVTRNKQRYSNKRYKLVISIKTSSIDRWTLISDHCYSMQRANTRISFQSGRGMFIFFVSIADRVFNPDKKDRCWIE